jgi:elongation factor P
MAMLDYNEIKEKKVIVMEGEPYEVLSSHVFRMQQRKPVNQTKLRSLSTGKVTERSFHQSERMEEADIEKKNFIYIYNGRGEWWFSEEGNPKNRLSLNADQVGDQSKFLKANSAVEMMFFDERMIGLRLPIKMEFEVKDAPPAVKGDTAQGGTKQATLETGAIINVPLFINPGDIIRINTETGDYVERAEKK